MILKKFDLGFQWPTVEPFLFCVHHFDRYPAGNGKFGLDAAALNGRSLGQDFAEGHSFRMYHGNPIPGFPVHPHRGFETVTVVRRGLVDHADSMGAAGRYGNGDVQWMTAGKGVQHSEMFPLLQTETENPLELFQIWLNLPKDKKFAEPDFKMFWSEKIPKILLDDGKVEVSIIAGRFNNREPLTPPESSWASDASNEVAIWLIKMQKKSKILLPQTENQVSRGLYFFEGDGLSIFNEKIKPKSGVFVKSDLDCELLSEGDGVEILLLQAKPIGEPIVQHGPFVMNSKDEIMDAFRDYQATQFGGWSWPTDDMVHGDNPERFAKYPNGKSEKP